MSQAQETDDWGIVGMFTAVVGHPCKAAIEEKPGMEWRAQPCEGVEVTKSLVDSRTREPVADKTAEGVDVDAAFVLTGKITGKHEVVLDLLDTSQATPRAVAKATIALTIS